MLRTAIVFLLMTFSLEANKLALVPQTHDNNVTKLSALDSAVHLLKAKQYALAYEKFNELFLKETDNIRINYYLGRSAVGCGKFEKAIDAFERVLIVEPDHPGAHLELGQLFFISKMYEQSRKEFSLVMKSVRVPQTTKEQVAFMLDQLDKRDKRNRLGVVGMLGLQFDNNINNDVGVDNYVINPDILPGGISGGALHADTIHQEMLNLNHIYDFGDLGGFTLQNSMTAFSQNYFQESSKNLLFISLASGIVGPVANHKISSKIHYDHLWIDDKELMRLLGVELGLGRFWSKSIYFDLLLHEQIKHYTIHATGHETLYSELMLNGKQYFTDSSDVLSVTMVFAVESAATLALMDRTFLGIKAGYEKVFGSMFTSNISLQYRYITFAQETLRQDFTMALRQDNQFILAFTQSYKMAKNMVLNLLVTHNNNLSTHNSFTYNKWVIGTNFMVQF